MALSKPVVPDTVQDESVIAQHYLVCGTEDCERNCQFYCNDCHQPMCEQCQAKHQKSPDTKNHEMVPYQQRKIQLPVEKCEDHPTKDVDMICEDCQVPDLVKEVNGYMSSTKLRNNPILFSLSNHRNIRPLAETIKPVPPVFTAGQCGKEDVTKLMDQLQKTEKNSYGSGFETVTLEGDLIYAERFEQVISKITLDNTTTELIKTGDWEPISVHSSRINGDILVGMVKDGKAKVTRYDKTGTEIQNIQWDNEGQELYSKPLYITENINSDICTSDFDKSAVVVVDKSGQHRFTYTDQGSEFLPYGIDTDILGHILVCDFNSNKVHLLDQDGKYA
uniref:Uncharacterized protein n=1 Tax=Magallana gigas TaxID=29159 RepID=K1QJY8_MAGGI